MGDRVNELTVGLFVEERMFADALSGWFSRRAPAPIRVMSLAAPSAHNRPPAIAIADEHLLESGTGSPPEGALGTVAILDDSTHGPRALRAAGYVAVTDAPEILVEAIQAVGAGTPFVSTEASRLLNAEVPTMPVPLTEKQRRLLQLYVDGLSLQQAAVVAGISFGTAGGYLKLIRKKFRAAGIPATTKIELGRALRAHGAPVGMLDTRGLVLERRRATRSPREPERPPRPSSPHG